MEVMSGPLSPWADTVTRISPWSHNCLTSDNKFAKLLIYLDYIFASQHTYICLVSCLPDFIFVKSAAKREAASVDWIRLD